MLSSRFEFAFFHTQVDKSLVTNRQDKKNKVKRDTNPGLRGSMRLISRCANHYTMLPPSDCFNLLISFFSKSALCAVFLGFNDAEKSK